VKSNFILMYGALEKLLSFVSWSILFVVKTDSHLP
jgi:hypothetical protein